MRKVPLEGGAVVARAYLDEPARHGEGGAGHERSGFGNDRCARWPKRSTVSTAPPHGF